MSATDQRLIADKVLNMLYCIDPYAIVAGGAPRDWYFGKEAADIDLFFYCPQASTQATMEEMLKRTGFKVTTVKMVRIFLICIRRILIYKLFMRLFSMV